MLGNLTSQDSAENKLFLRLREFFYADYKALDMDRLCRTFNVLMKAPDHLHAPLENMKIVHYYFQKFDHTLSLSSVVSFMHAIAGSRLYVQDAHMKQSFAKNGAFIAYFMKYLES